MWQARHPRKRRSVGRISIDRGETVAINVSNSSLTVVHKICRRIRKIRRREESRVGELQLSKKPIECASFQLRHVVARMSTLNSQHPRSSGNVSVLSVASRTSLLHVQLIQAVILFTHLTRPCILIKFCIQNAMETSIKKNLEVASVFEPKWDCARRYDDKTHRDFPLLSGSTGFAYRLFGNAEFTKIGLRQGLASWITSRR